MANNSKQPPPKQPMSSYLFWFHKNKEKIKLDHPGVNFGQLTKIGPKLWNEVTDKSEWEAKAIEDIRRYETEMVKWRAEGRARLKGKETKPTKRAAPRRPPNPISKISLSKIKPKVTGWSQPVKLGPAEKALERSQFVSPTAKMSRRSKRSSIASKSYKEIDSDDEHEKFKSIVSYESGSDFEEDLKKQTLGDEEDESDSQPEDENKLPKSKLTDLKYVDLRAPFSDLVSKTVVPTPPSKFKTETKLRRKPDSGIGDGPLETSFIYRGKNAVQIYVVKECIIFIR